MLKTRDGSPHEYFYSPGTAGLLLLLVYSVISLLVSEYLSLHWSWSDDTAALQQGPIVHLWQIKCVCLWMYLWTLTSMMFVYTTYIIHPAVLGRTLTVSPAIHTYIYLYVSDVNVRWGLSSLESSGVKLYGHSDFICSDWLTLSSPGWMWADSVSRFRRTVKWSLKPSAPSY